MIPSDRRFTETHEWVKIEGKIAIVGICDYAQEHLGDITFVELPQVGKVVKKGQEACVVESVKAASDTFSPISGTVSAVNNELDSAPETLNQSPWDAGWIFKLTNFDEKEMNLLMDAAAYKKFMEEHK